ncbi:MAG TPA: GspE/PulE family protein [Vicinamibacterales bacterium]|nr:GspE/PulE family protein [Vicinamibacterales bacterium]
MPMPEPILAPAIGPGRAPLGEMLVDAGVLSRPQLAHALKRQAELAQPIGRVVVALAYATDEDVRRVLAHQLGLRFVDLERSIIDPALARVINRSYARRHAVLPIALDQRRLTVALDDPTSAAAVESLRQLTGLAIDVVVVSSLAMQRGFRRLYEAPADPTSRGRVDSAHAPDSAAIATAADGLDDVASRRADEALRLLLQDALEQRCSDLHLEVLPRGVHLRYRVDGVLREPALRALRDAIDRNRRELVSRIKILSRLDIAERRRPQDGSFQFAIARHGRQDAIDLRVSVVPTYYGESVVIRMLDRRRAPASIDDLDLSPDVARGLGTLLDRTTGIVLVTGPTGSGKSTTLYGCLMRLHHPGIRILTAEDPVEYVYDGLSQCEVNDEIGNTFARFLRSFLRHDPEVIMVGEIRDEDTAQMAFRAAQTGHLLLSTLHTNSAIAALPRLIDLGIDASLISASLAGVLSQRLVRRICATCREPCPPPPIAASLLGPVPDLIFHRGAGCQTCAFTGFTGRLIVADLWIPDAADALLIARRAPLDEIRASTARTTIPMARDAAHRLRTGTTTLEELARVLPHEALVGLRSALT